MKRKLTEELQWFKVKFTLGVSRVLGAASNNLFTSWHGGGIRFRRLLFYGALLQQPVAFIPEQIFQEDISQLLFASTFLG
jgi:hypothetical protein